MHDSRACSDPTGQESRQSHLLYATKARWPATDECSVSAIDTEKTQRGRDTEEASRRHSKGREEKAGSALHLLHKACHMAAACWITNSGNLESPPVKSSVSFPSSSQLSNTITYFQLCFFPSLFSGLHLSLLCLYCNSFPLIHYSSTKYLLWQGHTVVDFPYSPLIQTHNNTQLANSTHTPSRRYTR